MVTLYYKMISHLDGESITESRKDDFEYPVVAEDIMHSMQRGVFNDDYTKFIVEKIVYELEEPPTEADCWDGDSSYCE